MSLFITTNKYAAPLKESTIIYGNSRFSPIYDLLQMNKFENILYIIELRSVVESKVDLKCMYSLLLYYNSMGSCPVDRIIQLFFFLFFSVFVIIITVWIQH